MDAQQTTASHFVASTAFMHIRGGHSVLRETGFSRSGYLLYHGKV